MPGERFITDNNENIRGTSLDNEEVCGIDSHLIHDRLALGFQNELCSSCSCGHGSSTLCRLHLCNAADKDCDYVIVTESCCASICSGVKDTGNMAVWIAAGLTGVTFGVALVIFLVVRYKKQRPRRGMNSDIEQCYSNSDGNSHPSGNYCGEVLDAANDNANRDQPSQSLNSQVPLKHTGASRIREGYAEPSAPLLDILDSDPIPPTFQNSPYSSHSESLGRNSPPPTYEDVIADDEAYPQANVQ